MTFTSHSRQLARCAALWLFLLTAASAADYSKISPDLKPLLANSSNNINVIVQYNSAPQTCVSTGLLGGLVCTTVNLLGGVVKVVFSLINAVSATLLPGDILSLSDQSNVAYISLDRPVQGVLDYTATAVSASYAWSSGWDGSGVGVAVIDSGIYPHPDLKTANSLASRVVYRQSFIGGLLNDDYGHGTHVAGIIAGSGKSSSGPGTIRTFKGIAPNANILDLRVLDKNGSSNDSAVIAAIEQAVKLKNKYNVRVINLSLGRPIYESCTRDPLCQVVEAAWKNGIVVVVAAGNLGRNGYATILSPANSPRALTVGAMKTMTSYPRSDDQIASYSSKGPTYIDLTVKPDVVAPGNQVVSLLAPGSKLVGTYPQSVISPSYYTTSIALGGTYFRLSGTSMATPVVSGLAAAMIQKEPGITPDTVKARLMKSASKSFPPYSTATDSTTGQTYTSQNDIFTVGAGYVDGIAALSSTDVATRSAQSPAVTYNSAQNQAYLVSNNSTLWGSSALWGDTTIWGTAATVNGTSAVWGASAAWGDSSQWGTSACWGDSALWGDSGRGE
jgi:serine protease AprX